MPFMTSVRRHLSDKGRTKRSEFWLVFLLLVLATMLAYRYARFFVSNANWLLLFFVLIAPFLWLYIATARRRCRDIGISVGYSWSTLYAGAGIPYVLLLGSLRSDAAKIPTTNNRTKFFFDTMSKYSNTKNRATRREYWFFFSLIFVLRILPQLLWMWSTYGLKQGFVYGLEQGFRGIDFIPATWANIENWIYSPRQGLGGCCCQEEVFFAT